MEYRKKIEYAEKAAEQLQGQKTTQEIKASLKAEGLYDIDINEVMVSARNILGEKYQEEIRQHLLADKQIKGAEAFSLLDDELLETLIEKETQKLALEERKKMTQRMKQGHSPEEVLAQVDTRFLSPNKALEQMQNLQEVKHQNSGSGRTLNIFGGIGLIVLTGILMVTINRIFYFLPVIGIIMIVKGFTTERMDYD